MKRLEQVGYGSTIMPLNCASNCGPKWRAKKSTNLVLSLSSFFHSDALQRAGSDLTLHSAEAIIVLHQITGSWYTGR